MHYKQVLDHPPVLHIESRVTQDRFYRFLEATWRWQQLPLAAALFAVGGVGFVLWGVGLRVAISLAGHRITAHFAHARGERPFVQDNIAIDGRIEWDAAKSLWTFGHMAGALVAVIWFPSWGGLGAFLFLAAITLCASHSVGKHRRLILRSLAAPKGLERLLVWLGTLVGMAGPFGRIRAHDMRDWHRRQVDCPPHPPKAQVGSRTHVGKCIAALPLPTRPSSRLRPGSWMIPFTAGLSVTGWHGN